MTRETHDREERVLAQLCEQLAHRERSAVFVVSRPDRDNDGSAEVDAIISRAGVEWAVEHTRVFDRPNRLGLRKRLEAIKPLIEQRVLAKFPNCWITIAVPVEELELGMDWSAAGARIAASAIAIAGQLEVDTGWRIDVEGFATPPIVFVNARGVEEGHCWVMALGSENDDELAERDIERALREKGPKIERRRAGGFKTLLLLDSSEALWHSGLYSAFERVATEALVHPFDEVYLAIAGWEPAQFILLKSGGRWPVAQPEFAEFVDLWTWARNEWTAAGRPVQ